MVVAYYAVGYWLRLDNSSRFANDFYGAGLALAFLAVPVLIGVLALARSHWWENDVGLNLVFLAVASMPENGGLAWTFLFDDGHISTSLLTWTIIGGPWWYVACSIWRFWLIRRLMKE